MCEVYEYRGYSLSFKTQFEYNDKGSMATIGKKDAVSDLKITFLNGR